MIEVHYEKVHFSGYVQGVGFRYTTLQVAREFEVTGVVANLADGRVELEVEGEPKVVGAFITAVEERLHGYIKKVERSAQKRPARFSDFRIQ